MGKAVNRSYEEARAYLYGFVDYERSPGWKYDGDHFDLARVREYLELLGSPHGRGRFVHVAGTNGKGSVSAIIAKSLTAAGMKTGLYTSPHLISFRERIRVDGNAMERDEVVAAVERIRRATDSCDHLTFFEVWTALAFDHFRYENVDAAVMEVGMGGRLDTTNIIMPDVSVITSISMDHAGSLGTELPSIAGEKGGIIKPDTPVVISPQKPEVLNVLESIAAERNAETIVIGRDVGYEPADKGLSYRGRLWEMNDIEVPLAGRAQMENTAVAIAALEELAVKGWPLSENAVRSGIEHVKWPGRLQTIKTQPTVIVDGACNKDAARVVRDHLVSLSDSDGIVMLVAMNRDKNAGDVLQEFASCASRFVLTRVSNPRMYDPGELACFLPPEVDVTIEPDVSAAIETAGRMAGDTGIVAASGSLYLVGDVMRHYGYGAVERI